ncbi:hypothetical protein O181_017502 [Austropuccinia psidii MF-1]|uniref:Uncharacterized protein n=1 Tax=Austropuccinia psidii MF-1 TaxID=1389203 RepID=A0A9Q3C606_9BASI|nr:hypothetical protein [Austropuccinia psidii MF-1]
MGTLSPEGRYKLSSITHLFTKIQEEGGIRNMTQYKKFIGEYEFIINYLKRYQYIQGDIKQNQEVLASLSSSVQESTYKEMIKNEAMVKTLDGGYIIQQLEILRLYIEQDLEAKVLIQQKEFLPEESQEKKARFEGESWEKFLKKMKDLTQIIKDPQPQENQSKDTGNEPLKEVLNQLKHLSEVVESPKKPQPRNNQDQRTIQKSQPFRPRYPSPPIFSGSNGSKNAIEVLFLLEEGHSAIRCNHITKDLEKRIVLKHGGKYLFPNFQRIPTECPKSAKELARNFDKEQEGFTEKMMEQSNPPPKKQEEKLIEEGKGEKETAIAQIEAWGNWKIPQILLTNKNLQ